MGKRTNKNYQSNGKPCKPQQTDGKQPQYNSAAKDPKAGTGSFQPRKDQVNDWQWYALSEQIGSSVANLPFNVFPGTKENCVNLEGSTFTDASTQSTPGVFVLKYANMPGVSLGGSSAVNIAANAIYRFVRHMNSGHSNYESADLMMYILAMDELYSSYLEAARIYRLANTYLMTNRHIPKTLLTALWVDPDNIVANLAQFRYGLNVRAAKISALAVPNIYHLFKRHALCATGIWVDSASPRAQFYMYRKGFYHKFNPTNVSGGCLDAVKIDMGATPRTYQDILNQLDDMIDVVITDEDMNIMSGDILKAYGSNNLYKLAEVNENEVQEFLFDEDILNQIQNLVLCPWAAPEDLKIDQVGNVIYSRGRELKTSFDGTVVNDLEAYLDYVVLSSDKYFNSHKDNPDWKDCLEWSRVCGGVVTDKDGKKYPSFGSEYVFDMYIYQTSYNNAHGGNVAKDYGDYKIIWESIRSGYMINYFDDSNKYILNPGLLELTNFDWHPIIYTFQTHNKTYTDVSFTGKVGDVRVYTLVSPEVRSRLHDAAIMGELGAQLTIKS